MGFVNRFWRFFRLGLLIIAFIAVGFYLLITTPWGNIFGKQPTYQDVVREGEPIVAAVYRFKAERGLWPEYLDDLAPEYLGKESLKKLQEDWYYEVQGDGRPGLSHATDLRRTHVGFDFDPEKPSWLVFGSQDNRVLKRESAAKFSATTLPAEKVLANELAELDRRLAHGPTLMEPRRAKASVLRSAGRRAEARQVIEEAGRTNADHFWPRLARVAMDLEDKPAKKDTPNWTPISLLDFDAWVRANPSFTRWYYLSESYRLAGEEEKAIGAVEEAAKLPAVTTQEDFDVAVFYLWDMARFALKREQWDLVVTLANSWESVQSDRRFKDSSYLVLRAAAKLAKGDVEGAKKDLEALGEKPAPMWAQNREALESAIKRGDRAFRYDPGEKPAMFQVFALPP